MREVTYISWLNYLGGFEYWPFTGYKDHNLEVIETGTTNKNIFPGWPKSYGQFADTITKQTFRRTRKNKVVRSQVLTRTQGTQLGEQLKSSPVVKLIFGTGKRDSMTVIVDTDSFTVTQDRNRVHFLNFTITYTDEYPSQSV
jgi:hypothetical protein